MCCIDYKEVLLLKRIIVGQKKEDYIRDGQFVFNVCAKWIGEKFSRENVTFKNDCFYNDDKIEAFLFEFVIDYLGCDKYHDFLNFLVENGVYQVNAGDLVGEINDFPIEAAQKTVENQHGQTEKYSKNETCDEANVKTEDSVDNSVIIIPFPKGYFFEMVDNDKGVVVFRKLK